MTINPDGRQSEGDYALPCFASSPVARSRPKAAAAIARKRNWRGQFIKNLRVTPDGSREWLIWSHYHTAWHCRSPEGGACGYTGDIARAGLFERRKADAYNDGDCNEAFHISEKMPLIHAAIRQHNEALERLNWAAHIASADTHPKGGDVKQAPLVSGAVGEAETPKAQRHD